MVHNLPVSRRSMHRVTHHFTHRATRFSTHLFTHHFTRHFTHHFTHRVLVAALLSLSLALTPRLSAQGKPTIAQFLSPAYPSSLVTAKRTDRIAWVSYERGMRNVYTAAAPDFAP